MKVSLHCFRVSTRCVRRLLYIGCIGLALACHGTALTATQPEPATPEVVSSYETQVAGRDTPGASPLSILNLVTVISLPLSVLIFAVLAWSWSLRKVVARRTAELQRSEEFQRAMIACSPVALYSLDLDHRVQTWNSSAQRIFGWSTAEVLGQPLPILPAEKQEEYRRLRQELVEGRGFMGREVVRVRKDGSPVEASLSVAPIHDAEGRMIGVMGAVEDITERKRVEARVAHLHRVLNAIRQVNQLIVREPDPVKLIREGCRLLVEQCSYKAALIVLADEQERPQLWAAAGVDPERAALESLLQNAAMPACCPTAGEAGESRLSVLPRTGCGDRVARADNTESVTLCMPLRHAETSHGYIAVTTNQLQSLDGDESKLLDELAGDLAYAISAIGDRAARERAEQARAELQRQLVTAQKMEAVGQLAGGVAHDFNNILQVMMGSAQQLIDETSQQGQHFEELTEIYRGAERAAALTRQLLAFSRRQVLHTRDLDVNAHIESLLEMIRGILGESVRLEWCPAHALGSVQADPAMLEQILRSLCVNARDAMPDGGTLTLSTRATAVDDAYCLHQVFASPGNYVIVSVADTGCGMDSETLSHMFEPFYTTKDVGSGSGLGLATVHGIVRQHNGWVEVDSQAGKGSRFSVFIPAQPGNPLCPDVTPRTATSGGTHTVLLVEDEPSLRALTRRFLEGRGYKVIEAGSGREALALWPKYQETIQVVITDLVMPEGISGFQLSEKLRAAKPALGVILTSGYSPEVAGRDTKFIQRSNSVFLPKPYATRTLLEAIPQALALAGRG